MSPISAVNGIDSELMTQIHHLIESPSRSWNSPNRIGPQTFHAAYREKEYNDHEWIV